ncbi:MAG: PIG-L family deacetylase [Thermoguttaceae bacterium]|nr:PIG-L family deacetylase [Thermoguttaceae bacterium]MBR4752390.1 PIG-L family deacetylase [Thermoguttaceae bacterium]MBR5757204.1 PIG-L family deacetylase [Thermoguttaceae bacterium]
MEQTRPKTVFAISAHPDDIEFTMAGTLFLLKDRGWNVHYMTIANGSWGTATMTREQIVRARREESIAAAEYMGATYHESLVDDLEIFYCRRTLLQLTATMREVQPDIVLTQSPSDYMEDHQNAVRLAVTAAFCRGMVNAPTEPPMPATYQDVAVYHAAPHGNRDAMRKLVRSERYVDVTSVIPRKREMLAKHKSQKEWLDVSQGYDSYLDSMQQAAALTGKLSGKFEYAEGWRRHNPLGFSAGDIDPLGDALADVSWLDPAYQEWLDS